ncbi:MAG: FAD-dependent oxidoreductase [Deltaproteobacteria bacterium]|nr:FAD-dependent oxidoreductase [Candidatus Anaeroferrophillacea bacterium]
METLQFDDLIAPADIREYPVSLTTTEANLTGSWKFSRPRQAKKTAPCRDACPLGVDIADWLHLLVRGERDAALHRLRAVNPLPASTGRVCPQFCRRACTRRDHDAAVRSGALERYIGDYGLGVPFPVPASATGWSVAVIGSGPAGLAAAASLAAAGVAVTVYEREAAPGGMLRCGIPAYRLPKEILAREIDNLVISLGIQLCCNVPVDDRMLAELLGEHAFVLAAPGLGGSPLPAGIGAGPGVYRGLELLRRLAAGEVLPGDRFAVIGGGNAAIDAARSLVRHGRQATIIYRRGIEEMPAYPEERREALEEGVEIRLGTIVAAARGVDGGRVELDLHEALRAADGTVSTGSFSDRLTVDGLVAAIGQKASWQPESHKRLLTAGDFHHGPASVAEALAGGRRAALEMLRRRGMAREPAVGPAEIAANPAALAVLAPQPGVDPPRVPHRERRNSFREVCGPLSAEEALQEAARCLRCGTCTACGLCWFFCPDQAVVIDQRGVEPVVRFDYDHCKGCGLCAASCPRGVIDMEEDS